MPVIVTDKTLYGTYANEKRSPWAIIFAVLSSLCGIVTFVLFIRFETSYGLILDVSSFLLLMLSVVSTFLLAVLASLWNNPHGMLKITPQGLWLLNARTKKISNNALWLSWEDVTSIRRGSFGLSATINLSNGHTITTGYFSGGVISKLVKNTKKIS